MSTNISNLGSPRITPPLFPSLHLPPIRTDFEPLSKQEALELHHRIVHLKYDETDTPMTSSSASSLLPFNPFIDANAKSQVSPLSAPQEMTEKEEIDSSEDAKDVQNTKSPILEATSESERKKNLQFLYNELRKRIGVKLYFKKHSEVEATLKEVDMNRGINKYIQWLIIDYKGEKHDTLTGVTNRMSYDVVTMKKNQDQISKMGTVDHGKKTKTSCGFKDLSWSISGKLVFLRDCIDERVSQGIKKIDLKKLPAIPGNTAVISQQEQDLDGHSTSDESTMDTESNPSPSMHAAKKKSTTPKSGLISPKPQTQQQQPNERRFSQRIRKRNLTTDFEADTPDSENFQDFESNTPFAKKLKKEHDLSDEEADEEEMKEVALALTSFADAIPPKQYAKHCTSPLSPIVEEHLQKIFSPTSFQTPPLESFVQYTAEQIVDWLQQFPLLSIPHLKQIFLEQNITGSVLLLLYKELICNSQSMELQTLIPSVGQRLIFKQVLLQHFPTK